MWLKERDRKGRFASHRKKISGMRDETLMRSHKSLGEVPYWLFDKRMRKLYDMLDREVRSRKLKKVI